MAVIVKPERTVIVSDFHMGRPYAAVASPDALRPLWRGASRLIVNGDAAELHHPHYRDDAQRQLRRLSQLCEDDGVELTLLSGNHDPFVSSGRHLVLEHNRVFITHGDALHPAIAPWSLDAKVIRKAYDEAFAQVHPEHRNKLDEILRVSEVAAMSQWMPENFRQRHGGVLELLIRPQMIPRILHYWHTIPRLAENFAKTHMPDAQFFILGHTHRHGVWRFNGLTVINTGCFGFPGRPLAVVIENASLSVFKILRHGGRYELAPRSRQIFKLAPPPSEHEA